MSNQDKPTKRVFVHETFTDDCQEVDPLAESDFYGWVKRDALDLGFRLTQVVRCAPARHWRKYLPEGFEVNNRFVTVVLGQTENQNSVTYLLLR